MKARKAKHFNILYRIGIICSRSLKKYQKPTISFMFSDSGDTVFSTIQSYISFFFFSFFFYYSYVHTRLGSFLPPAPTPSLTTHSTPSRYPPQYPAETILPLSLILL
jgi:hypothetical protein